MCVMGGTFMLHVLFFYKKDKIRRYNVIELCMYCICYFDCVLCTVYSKLFTYTAT